MFENSLKPPDDLQLQEIQLQLEQFDLPSHTDESQPVTSTPTKEQETPSSSSFVRTPTVPTNRPTRVLLSSSRTAAGTSQNPPISFASTSRLSSREQDESNSGWKLGIGTRGVRASTESDAPSYEPTTNLSSSFGDKNELQDDVSKPKRKPTTPPPPVPKYPPPPIPTRSEISDEAVQLMNRAPEVPEETLALADLDKIIEFHETGSLKELEAYLSSLK
eukprot:TRINITY_DN456_c0_g1_i2.p1 TRINITY_DN456_c0_g1~~TRINITY_DN456_c0_g1_i2.p1  ORF type:complete len:219 (-),score=60.86 TRINITY_DN456_c0_g1_i2:12-668(-)